MKGESDLSIMSMITNRIGWHEVQLPINHDWLNFQKNKQTKKKQIHLGQTSPKLTMFKVKNSSI